MNENTLLMPFLNQSESFVHGFECGQVWQRISEGETFDMHLIHAENIKQIEMICERFGVECHVDQVDDTWAYLTVKSVLA